MDSSTFSFYEYEYQRSTTSDAYITYLPSKPIVINSQNNKSKKNKKPSHRQFKLLFSQTTPVPAKGILIIKSNHSKSDDDIMQFDYCLPTCINPSDTIFPDYKINVNTMEDPVSLVLTFKCIKADKRYRNYKNGEYYTYVLDICTVAIQLSFEKSIPYSKKH